MEIHLEVSDPNYFYHVPFPRKGHGPHAAIKLRVVVGGTTLQYRYAETGLQYKHRAVQLIQAQCVHHKCV